MAWGTAGEKSIRKSTETVNGVASVGVSSLLVFEHCVEMAVHEAELRGLRLWWPLLAACREIHA